MLRIRKLDNFYLILADKKIHLSKTVTDNLYNSQKHVVPICIIRKFRNTIRLTAKPNQAIIYAPIHTNNKTILEFLNKHKKFIKKHIIAKKNRTNLLLQLRKLYAKRRIQILNTQIELKNTKYYKAFNILKNNKVRILIPKYQEKHNMPIKIYKAIAKQYMFIRVNQIIEQFNKQGYKLKFNKIYITSAKTRWGSCSAKKNLSFAYKLIMLNPQLIDYVIIHEISHLKYMCHCKNFWNLVKQFDKNYKQHEKQLKNYVL